jgi:hypothetical protein
MTRYSRKALEDMKRAIAICVVAQKYLEDIDQAYGSLESREAVLAVERLGYKLMHEYQLMKAANNAS